MTMNAAPVLFVGFQRQDTVLFSFLRLVCPQFSLQNLPGGIPRQGVNELDEPRRFVNGYPATAKFDQVLFFDLRRFL